ncbi:MAG TPA: esterase-like activity of phytase family protein, partial [Gammaproteobacteria bacterium]|nr:esterase-like activity of phytase family protein [Gammaproteobacteria bacterium]
TRLKFTTGIGSSAFHFPGDDRHTLYTASDRGANIKCSEDVKITGKNICKTGKIFPVPNFTPTIYKLEWRKHYGWKVVEAVQIKDRSGKPVSGLPNPLTLTNTEAAYDSVGNPIALNPNGLDTEAMVRLSDGSFWLSDEYAPSLVHVAPGGEVIERLVPAGIESDLAGADYPVKGVLPGILARRKLNRGIESLAISPDESYLYFAMQSPLANPDKAAYKRSRNVRLFKLDLKNMVLVGEYVYVIDLPKTFLADNTDKQSKVKVSEMVAYADDRLLLLERVSKTTKLYRVPLDAGSNILGSRWDSEFTSPSLEQVGDLDTIDIVPLSKDLALDSATDLPPGALPEKVEGVAIMSAGELVLVNDNDFGIKGADTRIVRLRVGRDFFKN